MTGIAVPFDASAFLRLDSPQSVGTSASGAAFATSTGDLLEVSYQGAGVFRLRIGPNTKPDYGLVKARSRACAVARRDDGCYAFTAGDTTLEIAASPLRIRLLHRDRPVLSSTTDEHFRGFVRLPTFGRVRHGGQWTAAFALASGEAVYGLGEKCGPLDKRGQLIHSHVVDALGVNTGASYKNVPFAWSPGTGSGAWGLFVHTPAMVSHGVGHPDWSHRSYAILVDDEALDLFLFAADTPAVILEAFTALTGRAPALPLWSLGLWVSRAYYETPEQAAAVAARLRERKIPCDVLTLDGRAAWRVDTRFDFDWDDERFPDPYAALARIREQRLRVCVWEYPYVSIHSPLFQELAAHRFLLTTPEGDPYVFGWEAATGKSPASSVLTPLPESGIVDFTHPAAFAWWRDAHERLFAQGVDVIDADFGEHVPDDAVAFNGDRGRRLHNVYPLLYHQCVFEATARFQRKDNAPPMVWARAGWTGSQRFAVHFGGDPQSDWEGLAASIRGALSWGMSGGPFYASAVGGFYGSVQPSPELYVRWLQAAIFGSHVLLHGVGEREPWAFGAEAEAVARKWLTFRYRLLPYLKRVIDEAGATGMPVMRAMPLAFPGDTLTRHCDTQFMCGDALLVAPVVAPGGEAVIALPPGGWYDLNSRQRVPGSSVIRYRAALDQFPVFGREGHALPLGRAVQHTGEIEVERPLELLWVFGKPTRALEGFSQVAIAPATDDTFAIHAAAGVRVERFGEAANLAVAPL